ncbi:MAG: PAC2 family protein [Nitrososphaerota archaeon]|nr:PAC2 family protein [Nitrososphaerales archaeon]MDW8044638.1 PAC2 family protein [Nitrososphaerota archaeon]
MTWVRYLEEPMVKEPIAIVASPGLRSVGKIALEFLIKRLKPRLIAELYSEHFPAQHETIPSYIAHPDYPGFAGVLIHENQIIIPKIEFYYLKDPELLLTKGYHANFQGQYEVAKKVLDVYERFNVKRMIVLAGYGVGSKDVCCAATDSELIEEMKKYGIETEYEGEFYGLSALIFGLGRLRGIRGVCLFGRTQPNLEDPEDPDPKGARAILERLSILLNIPIDSIELNDKVI